MSATDLWARLRTALLDEPPGGFFTWPVRLVTVLGALVVGAIFAGSALGSPLAWGLDYAALVSVSLGASTWAWVLLLNLVLAGSWLILSLRPPTDDDPAWKVWSLARLTGLNRHAGHLDALAVWMVLALCLDPSLTFQLPAVAAVVLLGEPAVNVITRFLVPAATRASGRLFLERRWLFYAASLAGMVGLSFMRLGQAGKLMPLFLAIGAGLIVRLARFMVRRSQERREGEVSAVRLERSQAIDRSKDALLGPGLALGAIAVLVAISAYARHALDGLARADRDGPPPAADHCAPEPGGPLQPTLAMFIVADSQVHALGGARFPGQMEAAELLVPVALRPVELDILSTATMVQYRSTFQKIDEGRGDASPLLWAHLGDLADLSCDWEMQKALEVVGQMTGQHHRLAGIAPGNHDRAFTGNFFWSPFWDRACASRLEKKESDTLLANLAPRLVGGAQQRKVAGTWLAPQSSALATVSPLGFIEHDGHQRGVVGVFLDTSDTHASDYGVAGLWGTFSERQGQEVRAAFADVRSLSGYGKPLVVVFAHHPLDAMVWPSRGRLQKLLADLDRGDDEPHLLAMITAHTHRAQRLRHCVAGRQIREIIVGSTIDPPQEAALLELGTDGHHRASLRVRTIPAVGRSGMTCGAPLGPSADRCRAVVSNLAARAECAPLFSRGDGGDAPGPACAELERPLDLAAQVRGLAVHGGSDDPDDIRKEQSHRARRLLGCVCRDGLCRSPTDPFEGEAHAREIGKALAHPDRAEELTCLSWAASVVQAHKVQGMEFADALRCAFDDATIQAAQESVATLEDQPCQ